MAIPASPATRSEAEWLERGRALVLRSDLDGALAVFEAAHVEHPASVDIALALAGVLWQANESERAEALLRALLAAHPAHVAATFLLAKILKEQARMNAVATTVRELFVAAPQPVGTTIQAIELLDDAGRKQDAADLCEAAIAQRLDRSAPPCVLRHAALAARRFRARARALRVRDRAQRAGVRLAGRERARIGATLCRCHACGFRAVSRCARARRSQRAGARFVAVRARKGS